MTILKNKMKMKKKYDQHKIERTKVRQQQKEQGVFDGRFNSRVEKPKNIYNRKKKHKDGEK